MATFPYVMPEHLGGNLHGCKFQARLRHGRRIRAGADRLRTPLRITLGNSHQRHDPFRTDIAGAPILYSYLI